MAKKDWPNRSDIELATDRRRLYANMANIASAIEMLRDDYSVECDGLHLELLGKSTFLSIDEYPGIVIEGGYTAVNQKAGLFTDCVMFKDDSQWKDQKASNWDGGVQREVYFPEVFYTGSSADIYEVILERMVELKLLPEEETA